MRHIHIYLYNLYKEYIQRSIFIYNGKYLKGMLGGARVRITETVHHLLRLGKRFQCFGVPRGLENVVELFLQYRCFLYPMVGI